MRKATVFVHGKVAGILEEYSDGAFRFEYGENYIGPPISLTMPITNRIYEFKEFPAFFEGLLPEGDQLEALLRRYKLDKNDLLGQLLKVGEDLVGAITVKEIA